MNSSSNTARGFGLVEVMASAAILAVGMTGMVSLFGALEDSYQHERLVGHALHIAEGTMEDLLVRYAGDTDLTSGSHTGASFTIDGHASGSFFTASWLITDAVPFAGTKEVTVTVTWAERGVTKRLTLKTVRT